MKTEIINSPTAQVAPAATIVGAHALGLTLSDWAAIAGIAFIALQAAYIGWKWWRDYKAAQRDDEEKAA